MRLKLENIGKLKSADIELSSITVIGGENSTGKSTVGKALFSIFNAFYNKDRKIYYEYVYALENALQDAVAYTAPFDLFFFTSFREIAEKILTDRKKYIENPESIFDYLTTKEGFHDEISVEKIIAILTLPEKDIFNTLLNKELAREFNGQIRNMYKELAREFNGQIRNMYAELDTTGSIELTLRQKKLSITVTEEEKLQYLDECNIITEAIYIDHPYLLDSLDDKSSSGESIRNHLYRLKSMLRKKNDPGIVETILINKKLENVFDTINSVCSGTMVYNNSRFEYKEKGNKNGLDVKNLASGLKTFLIIKTLLETGALKENGVLILDEPEIHLHPNWQLLFAEIIVLLHKEFGMHILINTHSPYFLEAIEVYSKKHGITNCKYYLAENSSEYISEIRDVSDETELIYKKLADPFQVLENIESEEIGNDE